MSEDTFNLGPYSDGSSDCVASITSSSSFGEHFHIPSLHVKFHFLIYQIKIFGLSGTSFCGMFTQCSTWGTLRWALLNLRNHLNLLYLYTYSYCPPRVNIPKSSSSTSIKSFRSSSWTFGFMFEPTSASLRRVLCVLCTRNYLSWRVRVDSPLYI